MRKVTAELASGAYPRSSLSRPHQYHSHRVTVDETGEPVAVACRVKPESVLPDAATYTDERPTCATCARAYDREKAK